MKRACLLLAEHPYAGVRLELLTEPWRKMTLRGFPHLLIYDPTRRPPVVVRIIHGARDLSQALGAFASSTDD